MAGCGEKVSLSPTPCTVYCCKISMQNYFSKGSAELGLLSAQWGDGGGGGADCGQLNPNSFQAARSRV
jgi:hypothetical protein